MNTGGDAAEQVVRMSLEGVEVAAKISGQGAKLIALHIAAALREEQKTKGKARLSSMLKSGRPLKVYEIRQKDLARFAKEAKRYGVLYCVLKDRNNKDENAMVDVISRVEDASKIQRITDRFKLVTMDTANVVSDVREINPQTARTDRDTLSVPDWKPESPSSGSVKRIPSVREKLEGYRKEVERRRAEKKRERTMPKWRDGSPASSLPKAPKNDSKER